MNQRRQTPAELQSAPINHSGIDPLYFLYTNFSSIKRYLLEKFSRKVFKTQLANKKPYREKRRKKLAVKNSFCYTVFIFGDMAELVDAADLKSADYYNLKGSSPFIPIENYFKKTTITVITASDA